MKKSVRILSAILAFLMIMPGIAKFTEPFKSFILQQLTIIQFPFPEFMQYAVKLGEITIGLSLLLLAVKGNGLQMNVRNRIFALSHTTLIITMIVAAYTHVHPNVSAEILPMGFKPPVMPIVYLLLAGINISLNWSDKRKN